MLLLLSVCQRKVIMTAITIYIFNYMELTTTAPQTFLFAFHEQSTKIAKCNIIF